MKKILVSFLILLVNYYAFSQEPDLTLSSYKDELSISALNSITLENGFYIPKGKNVRIFIESNPTISSMPTSKMNYILTRTFRTSVKLSQISSARKIDQENQSIQYFDGHGRPSQIVQLMASPNHRDIVQHIEYDGSGRESKKYLPYAERLSTDGSYKTDAVIRQASFYQVGGGWDETVVKTPNPYALTVFENSSLNRVWEQGAPGEAWQPAATRATKGRTMVVDYGTNTNDVRLWKVNAAGAISEAAYIAGKLNKTVLKDENWVNQNNVSIPASKSGTIEEYKDFAGRLVLKRVWESETKKLDTYYVYDDFGDLRYVLPPSFTETSFAAKASDEKFENFIYAYNYDSRRRVIEKKVPGKGWEWIVYNRNNLPIMSQDAMQRDKKVKEWSYIKYDAINRVTESGILTASYADQSAAQKAANDYSVSNDKYWEVRTVVVNPGATTLFTRYTNQSFPTANLSPRVVNYYDDHKFEGANTAGLELSESAYVNRNKTLLTGTKIYKDDGSLPLVTVFYFDSKARLIQSVSQNHLGGTDRATYTYSFVGEILTSKREHKSSGSPTTILTKNEYDHVGRLLTTKHRINNQKEIVLAKLEYNELGQLKNKKVHSENGTTFLNTTDYSYNERGWASKASSSLFTYKLNYNSGATPQYNGNVSQQLWGHASTTPNTFNYTYNHLNRLTKGVSTGVVMSEELAYDELGNITSLKRDNGTAIDYNYTLGNQKSSRLQSLKGGFTATYSYDLNGNATQDRTGMSFAYNYMNLPKTATKTGVSVSYLYDGTGTKLRKTATENGIKAVSEYVGGIEYRTAGKDLAIDRIATQEGYLIPSGSNYIYHYNLTDHLGNVRSVFKVTSATVAEVVQQSDYYPFGKRKANSTYKYNDNRYLYNGKELQDELRGGSHNLGTSYIQEGQYDYGFRFYDSEIGRWNVVDPMAEMHHNLTPYSYVMNNPINFVDPWGLDTVSTNGLEGEKWDNFDTKKDVVQLDEVTVPVYRNGFGGFGGFGDYNGYRGFGRFKGFSSSSRSASVSTSSNGSFKELSNGTENSFFGEILTGTEKHFNGSLGTLGAAAQGYNKLSNDVKRAYAYKLSRMTGIKSGQIFQRAKGFANGAGKLAKNLGPYGTVLGGGVITYEVMSGTWDAHTFVNGGLIVGAGVATFFGAPAVLTGIAIYGVGDYFFGINDGIDKTMGRKSQIWNP